MSTIANPLPTLEAKMNGIERWIFSQALGTNWTTTLWAELIAAAKSFLSTNGSATVAELEEYLTSEFTTIVAKLDGNNPIITELAGFAEAAFDSIVANVLSEVLAAAQADVG